MQTWRKQCQLEAFSMELHSLRSKGRVKRKSCLAELTPILGDDGLLRVGGRIGAASLPFDNLKRN